MSKGGRVLHADEGRVIVQGRGGELLSVRTEDATLKPGDLALLNGHMATKLWPHPSGEYPDPLSQDRHLHDPKIWQRLKLRAELLQGIRAFFSAHSFLEVETPIAVDSPGTEVHLAATQVVQSTAPGKEPAHRYLITSPEYHMKRLLGAGSPPIFQICKTFRDGERGRHHRPEFTMLEWYRPWSGLSEILSDCEALIRHVSSSDTLMYQGEAISLRPPWPRHTFLGLLKERAGIREPSRLTSDEQLSAFVTHVEPQLGRQRPEFVTEYPIDMASLAQPCPHDRTLAERSELYIAGLELANAFGELVDASEQRKRCEADNMERRELGLPELPIDEAFLNALTQGLPPSGGIALGVDRLAMLICDVPSIDDVLTF